MKTLEELTQDRAADREEDLTLIKVCPSEQHVGPDQPAVTLNQNVNKPLMVMDGIFVFFVFS